MDPYKHSNRTTIGFDSVTALGRDLLAFEAMDPFNANFVPIGVALHRRQTEIATEIAAETRRCND